jgi:hypothetical protein
VFLETREDGVLEMERAAKVALQKSKRKTTTKEIVDD